MRKPRTIVVFYGVDEHLRLGDLVYARVEERVADGVDERFVHRRRGGHDNLANAGVEVDPRREQSPFGPFGWFTDPEGNRVELWQPMDDDPGSETTP